MAKPKQDESEATIMATKKPKSFDNPNDVVTDVKEQLGNPNQIAFEEFSSLKEAQDAVYDQLSESWLSEGYPVKVWSKVSDDLIKKLWLMHKKKGGEAKLRYMDRGKSQRRA
jgi:hypothetical protein